MTDHIEGTPTIVVCVSAGSTLDLLCDNLKADGFRVLPAPSAIDGLRLCRYGRPDLMLLDVALPDASGVELLHVIREADPVDSHLDPGLPIIVLTGRGHNTDHVLGLDRGADDHVPKPFSFEELQARIRAVRRRRHSRLEGPVRVGEILIDPSRHKVTVGEREVHLTKTEFTLLRGLASDPTRVFGKGELVRDVWGLDTPTGPTRTLESHASRLRHKLDPEDRKYVVNCRGVGYRLVEG
jgi:DNA-binding response OmpR family regulator